MAEKNKLCPLKITGYLDSHVMTGERREVIRYCAKEKCEWWHVLNIQTKRGRCSLLTLAIALHWISVKEVK